MSGVLARCRAGWRLARLLAPVIRQGVPTPSLEGEALPKRIFELDPAGPAAPGGRTADYAHLSRQLWMRAWSGSPAPSPRDRALRLMHLEVLQAQELELRLLALLEDGP